MSICADANEYESGAGAATRCDRKTGPVGRIPIAAEAQGSVDYQRKTLRDGVIDTKRIRVLHPVTPHVSQNREVMEGD